MKLDVGSGHRKAAGFIGMDKQKRDGVDIVHDITKFPWPIEDSSCEEIQMNYVWGCIPPDKRIDVMNELWRVASPEAELSIREQYSFTGASLQDPCYYSGANELTWTYFIEGHPRHKVHQPNPWKFVVCAFGCDPVPNIMVVLCPVK